MTTEYTPEFEDAADLAFIQRIQAEVTQSCALPFAVPIERIPEFILQAAQWFWINDDYSVEQRMYVVKNSDFCKCQGVGQMNRILQLPTQIVSVQGCYKTNNAARNGILGDFSLERMMMTTYSLFGGAGSIGGGVSDGAIGRAGYTLTDVMVSMYEISTFDQYLNAPLTYNFNTFSHKLVVLGDMGYSDILIDCWKRLRLQDLYNNPYFFRYCVCLVKRALTTIYGTFEFKLPGGVTINYSSFKEDADNEIDQIKEWVDSQKSVDYFFQPNTL